MDEPADSATIRDATNADLAAITRIYNWTIIDNHVSFDTEPYTAARRLAWWMARDEHLDCLGTLSEVGHKLGRHWDTTILERAL